MWLLEAGMAVFFQPSLVCGNLIKLYRYSLAPLDVKLSLRLKALYCLEATSATVHGTLVCRGSGFGSLKFSVLV